MALVDFDIYTPCDNETLARHIEHSLSLGLPEADAHPLPLLKVIANGPSARKADLSGCTLAVNGALKLFTDQGLAPTMWAACDPQELVADFLKDAPKSTHYYLASKCHPSVFEALKDHPHVYLWHIDDCMIPEGLRAVPSASTITLTAIILMRRLGFRRIETHGWDCCYLDGLDHANPNAKRHPTASDVTVNVNGQIFHTTHSWAAEVQDAHTVMQYGDIQMDIRGGGMLAAVIDALKGVNPKNPQEMEAA